MFESEEPRSAPGGPPGVADVHRQVAAGVAGALIGGAVGGPEGAVVGGVVPPYALFLLENFLSDWARRRREAAAEVLLRTAKKIGADAQGVLELAEGDARKELIAGKALIAGAQTSSEGKIEALTDLLAAALLADSSASLDESAMLVDILSEIDAPHIRVLRFFCDPSTQYVRMAIPTSFEELPPYTDARSVADVSRQFPTFGVTLHGVVATLERLGLLAQSVPDLSRVVRGANLPLGDADVRHASVRRLRVTALGFNVFTRVAGTSQRMSE